MSTFDPFKQNFTMLSPDGTPMHIPLAALDEHIQGGVVSCINFGSQLGATVVTTLLLFLLTRAKKRATPVFVLNMSALLLNIVRVVCLILYYPSPWFNTYAHFSGDYSHVKRSDYATSILASVMTALVEIIMETSLIVQTSVVSKNMPTVHKAILLGFASLIAVLTIAFRITELTLNSILIMGREGFGNYIWLQAADTILITVSICFFSAVFMAKLGYTIHRRKKLGIHQFGPMQVIFIMSCQTMVIPAVLSALQWLDIPNNEMNACILTFVVISLPVTSIWASTVLPGQSKTQNAESGLPLWDKLSSDSSTTMTKTMTAATTTTHFDNMASRQFRQDSGSTNVANPNASLDPIDLIYQDLGDGEKVAANSARRVTSAC